ncbi:ABC transporter ATP-binding protein, partial [Listeria monocytogenes]|nr:ABC transporter ATP-binding protein [Listeria monocytogenes]
HIPVIFVTHYASDAEMMPEEILVMREGRLETRKS